MREVLTRRFTHGLKERKRTEAWKVYCISGSDLDGWRKGQVNVALQVLERPNLNIPVCGMVKMIFTGREDSIFKTEEISIEKSSEAFRLITRIQDEAHRFAIEYHRQLRGKGQVHSILDDIEGIGYWREEKRLCVII